MLVNMSSNSEMRRLLNSMSWVMIITPAFAFLSSQVLYPLFSLKAYNFISLPTLLLVFFGGIVIQFLIQNKQTDLAWRILLGFQLLIGLFLSQSELFGWGFTLALNIYTTFIASLIFPRKWQNIIVLGCIGIFLLMFLRTFLLKGEAFLFYGSFLLIFVCFLMFFCSVYLINTLQKQLQDMYDKLKENEKKLQAQANTLQEKSDWLEMITENLPVKIAYLDKEENLQFANPVLLDVFGLKAENLPVHSHDQALDMSESKEIRKQHRDLMYKSRSPVSYEYGRITPNGKEIFTQYTYVPHLVRDEVVGRIAIGIDITELRQTQKTLQNQNDIFSLVLNNIPARIIYIGRSGKVIFANAQIEKDLGLPIDQIIGQEAINVIPKETFQYSRPFVLQAFRKKRTVSFEGEFEKFDNQRARVNIFFYPHVIDGFVQALFVLYMDVTEQRNLEDALARSQKLESLGVLAGGIAHDFNNLLTAILGQLSVAQYKLDADHPAVRHVEQSISATKQTAELTQQMLAYSGRGSFSVGRLDVNQLIVNNLPLFDISLQINVQLETELQDDIPVIEADAAQIQQLLMNLVINAGQAIGVGGGTIRLKTAVYQISDVENEFWEYTGELKQPGEYVLIQIEDTGAGMEKDTIAKIFDPFFTTKEKGSGLGLATALGIIRGHKAGISVASEIGKGTIFSLYFPVSLTQELLPIKRPAPNKSAIEPLNKILIIDDDLHVLNTVTEMLNVYDIGTIAAQDGTEGIDLYLANQEVISVVLLDLMMPGLSGEEVYLKLKEINPKIKVILSSGYSKVEALRRFVGQGVVDFIQKPYDIETLVATFAKALQ
ncbi:MAG: PAS domain S-box protein [Chloroflexota bacterium]